MNPKNLHNPLITVVIPVFDEQECIKLLLERVSAALAPHWSYEIMVVDDGSCDKTPDIVEKIAGADSRIKLLRFSRNFGHQAAITAGLNAARGAAVVIIDGDLQDPPELIPSLVDEWRKGFKVVYAVRQSRKEGIAKRAAYRAFYVLMRSIVPFPIPLDSGDFSLIDREVLEHINKMPERTRFVRGLRAWVGFRQIGIPYDREERAHGSPKYTLGKLFGLGKNGIMTFSGLPLRIAFVLGISLAFSAVISSFGLVFLKTFFKIEAPLGWTSLAVGFLFFSGLQFMFLGIIGEYLSLVLEETQQRPNYIIEKKVNF